MAQWCYSNTRGDMATMIDTQFLNQFPALLITFMISCGSTDSNGSAKVDRPIAVAEIGATQPVSVNVTANDDDSSKTSDCVGLENEKKNSPTHVKEAAEKGDALVGLKTANSASATGAIDIAPPAGADNDPTCRHGQIKRVETSRFAIRVVLCSSKERTYKFKRPVVDIKINPAHPYVAVYTTSLDDDIPAENTEKLYPATLYIINAQKGRKTRYNQAWSPAYYYDIWSPKGTYTAFLRGDYGPIVIVKTDKLSNYLRTYTGKYRIINTNKNPSSIDPPQVVEIVGWQSEKKLIITNGCCGDIWKTEYNLETDSYRRLECAYGYCMCTRVHRFVTHQNDVAIDGGALTKYEVSVQLRGFFRHIWERCFQTKNGKSMSEIEGGFSLSFELSEAGKVVLPKISDFKTEIPLRDVSTLTRCLIENTKKMSFKEFYGTKSVSVRVVIGNKKCSSFPRGKHL